MCCDAALIYMTKILKYLSRDGRDYSAMATRHVSYMFSGC